MESSSTFLLFVVKIYLDWDTERYWGHMQNSKTNPDPDRYSRRCPDPNAKIQKFIHYMATTPQWVVCRIVCKFSLRILICILPRYYNNVEKWSTNVRFILVI